MVLRALPVLAGVLLMLLVGCSTVSQMLPSPTQPITPTPTPTPTPTWMSPGAHTMETTAVDKNGDVAATVLPITVGAQPTTTVSDIQDMSGWENCGRLSAQLGAPRPDPRRRPGRSRLHHDPEPVLARARRQISQVHHGWPHRLLERTVFHKSLGGETSVSHFTYDLYFYVDNPNAPQALEFDVNPAFGGTRWTWGTECNFDGSGKWDIWYPLNEKWIPTAVDYKPFSANTWIHLVWNFERINGQAALRECGTVLTSKSFVS